MTDEQIDIRNYLEIFDVKDQTEPFPFLAMVLLLKLEQTFMNFQGRFQDSYLPFRHNFIKNHINL